MEIRRQNNCRGSNEHINKHFNKISHYGNSKEYNKLLNIFNDFCIKHNVETSGSTLEIDFWTTEEKNNLKTNSHKYHNNEILKYIKKIENNENIDSTDKETLIKARIGQGKFRDEVIRLSNGTCRVTGVNQTEFLIASHIKPWRDSTNEERLDGYNGLLLSPHIDKLFDKGFISFEDNGDMITSESIKDLIDAWNITERNVGEFLHQQKKYLKEHREKYFKNED